MTSIDLSAIPWAKCYAKYCSLYILRRLLSTVNAASKVSFMPRFLALTNEHKLDDLISFCVNAIVLAAAQILQESWRFLFEFTARFASLFEMSDKQNDFAADLCSIVPAD